MASISMRSCLRITRGGGYALTAMAALARAQRAGTPGTGTKDSLPISSGERYEVLVKVGEKHKGLCTSCNIGKGISIMHDHNLRGVASDGKYPKGGLTIFEVK